MRAFVLGSVVHRALALSFIGCHILKHPRCLGTMQVVNFPLTALVKRDASELLSETKVWVLLGVPGTVRIKSDAWRHDEKMC